MTAVSTRSRLSSPRRRLLDLMAEIRFGRIEGLIVTSGEPIFVPAPRIVREIRFHGRGCEESERSRPDDFALKKQFIEFFDELDRIGDGRIDQIEIQDGLPFRMRIETQTERMIA